MLTPRQHTCLAGIGLSVAFAAILAAGLIAMLSHF